MYKERIQYKKIINMNYNDLIEIATDDYNVPKGSIGIVKTTTPRLTAEFSGVRVIITREKDFTVIGNLRDIKIEKLFE